MKQRELMEELSLITIVPLSSTFCVLFYDYQSIYLEFWSNCIHYAFEWLK